MIQRFSDHSANERTFLAWVRTGISVIAFGFVVEKFNLFIETIAGTVGSEAERQLWTRRLASPFGRVDGMILMVVGIALIVIAGCASCAPPASSTALIRGRAGSRRRSGWRPCWRSSPLRSAPISS
jgi:hypothetical protein